jgi:hypothetical protein
MVDDSDRPLGVVHGPIKIVLDPFAGSNTTGAVAEKLGRRWIAIEKIDEADFRYPGPKPRFKEAAIMMLADSCEAAARSLAGSVSSPRPHDVSITARTRVKAVTGRVRFERKR